EEINARYFETPYFLLPGKSAEKPYALLREVIRKTGKVGIGRVILRTNAYHLVSIRTDDDALTLEIMRFADELVDDSTFTFPASESVPTKYHDEYRANL